MHNFFSSVDPNDPNIQGWEVNKHKLPLLGYMIGMVCLAYRCFKKNYSLIPCLGLASCGYLISELGWTNWVRFLVWLAVGLVIYFYFGIKHSKLAR